MSSKLNKAEKSCLAMAKLLAPQVILEQEKKGTSEKEIARRCVKAFTSK